jgi:hypothetical protein
VTKAAAQAPVKETVTALLEKMGVSTQDEKATAPDWTKLQDIARELQYVTVHLIRYEQTSFWGKTTNAVDAGTYRNIPVEVLISGTAEWIHDQAGGGDYKVEVIHPTDVRMGRLTSFKVTVPGESRKPAPLAAKEATAMLTARTQAQGLARQLMEAQPGMNEVQAVETAQKMISDNPMAAAMFGGAGGAEDDMAGDAGKLMQMMMVQNMMRENSDRQERIALLTAKPTAPAEDMRLKALEERLAEQDRRHAQEKADWDRREQERRFEEKFRGLEDKFSQIFLRLDKPAPGPTIDPTTAVLGQILPTFVAQQDQRASEQARAAESQMLMMKSMLEASNRKDPALDSLLTHMLSQTQLAMQQQQLKLQEPVKQAEALNSVFSMMGGMMQVTHQIILQQMAAQQGNPFWDRLAAIADQLPQIIMGLANPEVEHGTIEGAAADTVDERAASSRVQQMRAADQAAQAVAAGGNVPQVQATQVEPSLPAPVAQETQPVAEQQPGQEEEDADLDESALPEDPVERAKIILQVFGIEAAAALLEKPDAVEALDLFWKEGVTPSALGEKLANLLLGLEIVVDVKGDDLVRQAREQLGWSPQRAGKFAAAFEKTIKAASEAAA